MLLIELFVVHKMSVCDCACVLSGFGILHSYEGLLVSCGLSEASIMSSISRSSDLGYCYLRHNRCH